MHGRIVGPRTGFGRRTTEERELYCFRQLLLWLDGTDRLNWPLAVFHDDRPDFLVEDRSSVYGFEITEACPTQDGHEMALAESEKKPFLIGELGGRGREGFVGNVPNLLVADDLQGAIDRKDSKDYLSERPTDLLIYANSNPKLVLSETERRSFGSIPFCWKNLRYIFVMWNENMYTELTNE